ncbi:MAG: 50S ribosomal protein L21 [Rickettsiales bacterium]|nr:50S ribosomal protein L21 [Rickettsiales bacterium]|tara:strand:- start:43 stop:351 length:309 start_codon:yes stop_codon:yes gene_type:complete
MYAVIETSGRQYKVSEGDLITVDSLDQEVGAKISLDRVLMTGGDEVKVGQPYLDGANVEAEVTAHGRGPKLVIFKLRRRQNSRRKRGFRSSLTTLRIAKINA